MNPKTEIIDSIVDRIKDCGVRFCIFDFDETLVKFNLDRKGDQQFVVLKYLTEQKIFSRQQNSIAGPDDAERVMESLSRGNKEEVLQSLQFLDDVFFAHPLEEMQYFMTQLIQNDIKPYIISKNKNLTLLQAAANLLEIGEAQVIQKKSEWCNKIELLRSRLMEEGSEKIALSSFLLIDDNEAESPEAYGMQDEDGNTPFFIHVPVPGDDVSESELEDYVLFNQLSNSLDDILNIGSSRKMVF